MDGHQQRKALTAAERAVAALGKGDADAARRAAGTASSLDQVGAFAQLVAAVATAADDLDRDGEVRAASWDHVAAAVGPGPVAAAVATYRG
ncbi:MAG: hypothetical protein OEM97_06950 [Acidimicrobiia bacterium]|nr:hypothetical protein [Acidimicrobiia bacterium]